MTIATIVVDGLNCQNDLLGTFQRQYAESQHYNYGGTVVFQLPKHEGPRTRVDQPKIKYWKLHECNKKHTLLTGQKFEILQHSAASEISFKSIPMLEGIN